MPRVWLKRNRGLGSRLRTPKALSVDATLEIENAVGGLHGRVEERHVGQGHRRFRLHAVEAQALASGGEHAFAEAKELGLRNAAAAEDE